MAKVTCKETKEKIEKDTAFSVTLKGRKTKSYFKDEETYNLYMEKSKISEEESDNWKQCKDMVVNFVDAKPNEKVPPYIFKKLHEVKKDRGSRFLLYLLTTRIKQDFGQFYKNNRGATLEYKCNMIIYFINKHELDSFIKFSEKEALALLTNIHSEKFKIKTSAKRDNPLEKYFEEV